MKVIKKTIVCLLLTFCYFSFFSSNVFANTINNIDIYVDIDEYGNAKFTEMWDAYLDSGTEGYKSFKKVDVNDIYNFKVEDQNREYLYVNNWNNLSTFEDKKYKNGILLTNNGFDLCFGISNYGNNNYVLTYEIKNFVTQFKDYQGIYFNFLNLDIDVNNVKIIIKTKNKLDDTNSKIWGFGYDGEINFSGGNVVLKSNGVLYSYEYMASLIKFEEDYFILNTKDNRSFDEVKEDAFNGVDFEEKEDIDYSGYIALLGYILFFVFVIIVAIISGKKEKKERNDYIYGIDDFDYGLLGEKMPDIDEVAYYRDIPCSKHIGKFYFLALTYDLGDVDDIKEGLISAFILKWIKENKIEVISGKLKINYNFYENSLEDKYLTCEKKLFDMIDMASGTNKELDTNEFSNWCKKHYKKIDKWFIELFKTSRDIYEQEGLITNFKNKKILDSKLKEEAINILGLKRFLLEFSKIADRNYYEVHLWEEYLIFACILGIADKAKKELKEIVPEFESVIFDDTIFDSVNTYSRLGYRSYNSSGSYSSGSSGSGRSGGFGGSSFSGGGSSSAGSSGGGFR